MTETITKKGVAQVNDLNRDPITGTPGAHPIGTGTGTASAGTAGAAVGLAAGGPLGAVIGATVGAMAGRLAGKGVAEAVNPTAEEGYWKESYVREPYYTNGKNYDYYAPGFKAGWEGRVHHDGRTFEQAESQLEADYDLSKSSLDPVWMEVKSAARAAWHRVDRNWKAKQ